MYRKKNFVSLGISLILAAGITVTPVTAADFTDGTVSGFNSEDTAEFGTQQETSDEEEITSGTEEGISEEASEESGSDEKDSDETEVFTEKMIPKSDVVPNNRQLLEEYLNDILYGQDPGTQPAASVGEDILNGQQQTLYEELKSKISAVASKGGSTRFKITSNLGLTWQTTVSGSALEREVAAHLKELDISKIIDCLAVDCPYELYWYEKTASTTWQYNYSTRRTGNKTTVKIENLSIHMPVTSSYASSTYKVNAQIVQLARMAAENARMIVKEFQDFTETEKLYGYKETICYLTSYNDDVTEADEYEYGDPWQLIYVFDGDDSTNVVCEGYSKAFQYLCDLSDITCYTVTGMMDGGTGEGPHMWNVVANNGRYYMADITNSDEGTVGEDGGLFLDTPISGSISRGYTYATDSSNIYFAYDKETKDLYGAGNKSILYMTQDPYSADDLTAKPPKTSITGISNKMAGRLSLTWKKSKGAAGYEIYRRAGTTHPYVRAKVIKSGSTTKYTNTKLKKGQTYYYRIRSYRYDEKGRKIYSGWSTVKKQKVR